MDGDLFDFHAHVRLFQSLWIIVQQQTSSNVLRCDFYSDSSETVARVEGKWERKTEKLLFNKLQEADFSSEMGENGRKEEWKSLFFTRC